MSATRREILLALRRPLLTFHDLPALRAWEGKRFQRDAGSPYVSDALVPSGIALEGHVAMRGLLTHTGLYVIQWYGLPNKGLELGDTADAVVALYPPGTSFVTDGGNAVQVLSEPAPWSGQVRAVEGAAVVTITVPYQCVTLADLPTAA